jgi:hypothetical protein
MKVLRRITKDSHRPRGRLPSGRATPLSVEFAPMRKYVPFIVLLVISAMVVHFTPSSVKEPFFGFWFWFLGWSFFLPQKPALLVVASLASAVGCFGLATSQYGWPQGITAGSSNCLVGLVVLFLAHIALHTDRWSWTNLNRPIRWSQNAPSVQTPGSEGL